MRSIEWTKIKEDTHRWVVTEAPSFFTARFAKRGGKRLGPRHLVNWSSTDVRAAMSWLRAQALDDRLKEALNATCAVCATTKHRKLFYSWRRILDSYCSEKCYDTLFGICLDCGQRNMRCAQNAEPNALNPSWGGPENHICDPCHQKKHKWHVCTITSK